MTLRYMSRASFILLGKQGERIPALCCFSRHHAASIAPQLCFPYVCRRLCEKHDGEQAQNADQPAGNEHHHVLLFGMDGDELPNQRARPIIEGHAAADAGAFQTDFAAVAKRTVNMVITGHKCRIFSAVDPVEDLLGKLEIFQRRFGGVLQNDV